jgi:hypothetical protein
VPPESDDTQSAILAAIVTAAASIAFQVGGKATRDTLFLSILGAGHLPVMMAGTAILAIVFAFLSSRALSAWGPGRVIPIGFGSSAALLLVEWGVSFWNPALAAVLLYLHCGCLGGLLISGFWSLLNERFDPRTMKRRLGAVAAWGTLGGVAGGLIATRVSATLPATAMLPILSLYHVIAAVSVARVGTGLMASRRPALVSRPEDAMKAVRPGLRALAGSGYLRGLVTLVFLVTVCEGLIDFAFKTRANVAWPLQGDLLQFFAVFYAVASLFTLLVQMIANRVVLERMGPAQTAAILPAGVVVASAGALAAPGLTSGILARAVESILSNSVYRGSYEVLFTPVPQRDKRAVKPLTDVGAARIADLIAAGIAQAVMAVTVVHGLSILVGIALAVAILAGWTALRLHGGYVRSLERGLRSRAVELDLSEVRDRTTRSIMLNTLNPLQQSRILRVGPEDRPPSMALFAGPYADRISDFRSRDPSRVRRALQSGAVAAALVPEVISLLAQDDVAREAIEALRGAGVDSIEPLIIGLLDPREEFAIRRRIPLVLATYRHPRAVEGLSHGLADRRFEVRYRCGRGLSHLTEIEPAFRVEPPVVYEAVLREVEVGAGVWEGRRLLDRLDDEAWSPVVDDAIRERADRSLEHVFTLLALVLPRQPLRIAFRGLHVNDPYLRGTALEYLESALPPEIRKPLWPYLEDRRSRREAVARPTDEALAKLLSQNESIVIHLEELRRKETRGE